MPLTVSRWRQKIKLLDFDVIFLKYILIELWGFT